MVNQEAMNKSAVQASNCIDLSQRAYMIHILSTTTVVLVPSSTSRVTKLMTQYPGHWRLWKNWNIVPVRMQRVRPVME